MQDDTRSDTELAAELAAIDVSAHHDSPAALTASLGGRPDLLALVAAHHAAASARRLVVVELLSNAALPRRLAAFDRLLEAERDALAAAREDFASTPRPAPDMPRPDAQKVHTARWRLRQRIDTHLDHIGAIGARRVCLAVRQANLPRPVRRRQERGF